MVRAYKKRTLLKFVCSADYVARGTIVAYTDAYFVFGGAWHWYRKTVIHVQVCRPYEIVVDARDQGYN